MSNIDAAHPTVSKRVLIVDDSSLVRLFYKGILETAGYQVEQAINGIEALEKIFQHSFDALIVDVNMPRMDGLSFVRELRNGPTDVSSLPVIIVTTEAAQSDLESARVAGANFYLPKPISESALLLHVAALCGAAP